MASYDFQVAQEAPINYETIADVMRASAYSDRFVTSHPLIGELPIRVIMKDDVIAHEEIQAVLDAADLSLPSVQDEAITRKSDALGRLRALGTDAVRVAGLPDLSGIVADIVEALDDLDVGL